jgi:SnoaL-like domain
VVGRPEVSACISRSAANHSAGGTYFCSARRSTKHLLSPSVVRVFGQRAIAETSVAILVRQDIKGVATDLTAHARFLDRLEQDDFTWRIVERTAVYERDRLDPVVPSVAFDELIQSADCARYPAPYRYMAFRIAEAGGSLAMPVLYDGLPETDVLRTRYRRWLAEAG